MNEKIENFIKSAKSNEHLIVWEIETQLYERKKVLLASMCSAEKMRGEND